MTDKIEITDKTLSSKHFCYAAFMHSMVDNNNSHRLCCLNEVPMGSLNNQGFSEIWQSENYKKVRQDMLNDQPIKGCEQCYKIEELGALSDRQTFNRRWNKVFPIINVTTGTESNFPNSFDLRSSNLCNLKCLMCGPGSSYQISKEIKTNADLFSLVRENGILKTKPLTEYDTPSLKLSTNWFSELQEKLVDVRPLALTLLGGEPSIIPEYYSLLNKLIEVDNTDVTLTFVTNLTNVNANFKQILRTFKKVDVICSLDGIGKTVEYIRYPLNFQQWRDNFDELIKIAQERDGAMQIAIHSVIQLLNLYQLPKFLEFLKEYQDVPNVRFSFNNVMTGFGRGPFDLKFIPYDHREQILGKIYENYTEDLFNRGRLVNVIDVIKDNTQTPSEQEWTNLVVFLLKRDISRNIHLKDYVPEVYELIADRYETIKQEMLARISKGG